MIKHALAKKRAADRHAIKAARQLASTPDFHTVRPAETVKLAIIGYDLFRNPSVSVSRCAALNYGFKIVIDGNFKVSFAQRALQAVGNMKTVVQWNDRARVRREPADVTPAIDSHRENTTRVTMKNQRRSQQADLLLHSLALWRAHPLDWRVFAHIPARCDADCIETTHPTL